MKSGLLRASTSAFPLVSQMEFFTLDSTVTFGAFSLEAWVGVEGLRFQAMIACVSN